MKTFITYCIGTLTIVIIIISASFYLGYDKFIPTSTHESVTFLKNSLADTTNNLMSENNTNNDDLENLYYNIDVDWSKTTIDKVEVYKSARRLDLVANNQIVKSYHIRLGFEPLGHKTTEGDGKTPEGKYTLDWRNPHSQFYKSLHISYPNKDDKAQAQERGVSAGGDVMIHGSAKKNLGSEGQTLYDYLPRSDWTLGCVAVNNKDMDELWENVKNGTAIEIFP